MNAVRCFFGLSGIYDLFLGLMFLFAPIWCFNLVNITPPNHWGYVTFAASMLSIFGIMFLQIAKDPIKNRGFMPYGMLLKLAYCGVVFGYYLTTGIPTIWAVFGVCDFIFLLLFIWSYKKTADLG